METALSTLTILTAKYIGVILEKKLLWTDNILDRTRKWQSHWEKVGFLPHDISLAIHCNSQANSVNIYTDGSKLNSQTGGGVFSPELDIKVLFRLQDQFRKP